MADTKLSALTALAVEMADTDEIYVNDGGASKKQAYSVFKAAFATAAQGTLAASALQPGDNISGLINDAGYEANAALASQAEAEAGTENTKTMTALRVAQAIAALAGGISEVSEDTSPTLGGNLDVGAYKIEASGSSNIVFKLPDNAGARKLSLQDSSNSEVAHINSDGGIYSANGLITGAGGNTLTIGAVDVELVFGTNDAFQITNGTYEVQLKAGPIVGPQGGSGFALTGNTYNTGILVQGNTPTIDVLPAPAEIKGGNARSSATTNITGSIAYVTGGDGASGSAGDAHGGNVVLTGGTGYGTGHKGYIILDLDSLPTSDPSVNGALWLDTGTLSVSGA